MFLEKKRFAAREFEILLVVLYRETYYPRYEEVKKSSTGSSGDYNKFMDVMACPCLKLDVENATLE